MKRLDALQPPATGGLDDQGGVVSKVEEVGQGDPLFLQAPAQTPAACCLPPCSLQVATPAVHSAPHVDQCQPSGGNGMPPQPSAWGLPTRATPSEDEFVASVNRQSHEQVAFPAPAVLSSGQAPHQPGSVSSPAGCSIPNSANVFCGDAPLNVQEYNCRVPPAFRGSPSGGSNCTASYQPLQTDSGGNNTKYLGSVNRECESLYTRRAYPCPTVETLLGTPRSSPVTNPPNVSGPRNFQVGEKRLPAGDNSSEAFGGWPAFRPLAGQAEESHSGTSTEDDSLPTVMIASSRAANLPLSNYDAMKLTVQPSMSYACRNDVELGPKEVPPLAATCAGALDRPLHQSSGYKKSRAAILSLRPM